MRMQLRQTADPISTNSHQNRVNTEVYSAPDVTQIYTRNGLELAESVALLKYRSAFVDRDVLDIGIGTGRTTAVLAGLARSYVGIDYSETMVRFARRRFPDADIRHADMRDLGAFAEGSFDFVFATNNVIDAVSHDDRLKVFVETRRVLRPGGALMFSSHNRDATSDVAKTHPELALFRNPVTQIAQLSRYLVQRRNFKRLQPYFEVATDHVIQADIGHDFSLLHYYIDHMAQRSQLANQGFESVVVFTRDGLVAVKDTANTTSPWLMYVAQ